MAAHPTRALSPSPVIGCRPMESEIVQNVRDQELMLEWERLTPSQQAVMTAAWRAPDGWITKTASCCWYRAPTSVHDLVRRGYLHMPLHGRRRACLTEKGSAIAEARLGDKPC